MYVVAPTITSNVFVVKLQAAAIKRALRIRGARVLRTDLSGTVSDAAKNRDQFDLRVR